MKPSDAAKRLLVLAKDFENYPVPREHIENLRLIGVRFADHFEALRGFSQRLHDLAEGFAPC